jgi:alpha/beta superfamily hydrolase
MMCREHLLSDLNSGSNTVQVPPGTDQISPPPTGPGQLPFFSSTPHCFTGSENKKLEKISTTMCWTQKIVFVACLLFLTQCGAFVAPQTAQRAETYLGVASSSPKNMIASTLQKLPFEEIKSLLSSTRWDLNERKKTLEKNEEDMLVKVNRAYRELETLKATTTEISTKDFEIRMRAKEEEVRGLQNLRHYYRSHFKTIQKEKQEYIEELEEYISVLESDRRRNSFRNLGIWEL